MGNGEATSEPLQDIAKDDPMTCAIYSKENGLLDMPGWKQEYCKMSENVHLYCEPGKTQVL